jgi:glyoxylase-like metal-dependent hydrolase (beta-lactamase superfamily II)
MNHWNIGEVKITRVIENEGTSDISFLLKDATPENISTVSWLRPHFADALGLASMSVHTFVVVSQDQRIVVDTCIGNDKRRSFPGMNMLRGPFLADLEAAGFAPDSIDRVLCTHLHSDHVGWNTRLIDGTWQPTFPKARYLVGRTEWEYCSKDEAEDTLAYVDDSVRPVFDAGLVDLVESNHQLTEEVWLEPTPGHTAGHHSVRVSSRGEEAVITGDLMHHPVQVAHPEWGSSADFDYEQAIRTRRAFVERYGDTPVLVLGTHFASPTAGRIVRDGSTWRLDA